MEGNEGSKEGLIKRVLNKLNLFSNQLPDASDEFQAGIDRNITTKPGKPQTQEPPPLIPEPQH